MRASVDAGMSADKQPTGFRRQIVVRLDAEQWPLLQSAAAEHGSIQRAVVAALQALVQQAAPEPKKPHRGKRVKPSVPEATEKAADDENESHDEEISAREAATILGIKPDSVRGYIRSGRLPGRYDGEPTWGGWLTTREAVDRYRGR
jgi:hypothetical protein